MYKSRFSKALLNLIILLTISLCWVGSSKAQDSLKRAQDSARVIPDTLLFRIQTAQAAITEIYAANKKGYDVSAIQDRLAALGSSIASVKRDFGNGKGNAENRSLVSFKLILKDVQTELSAISARLVKTNSELQRMSQQVIDLNSDSLLLADQEESEKMLYRPQLLQIKTRLHETGEVTGRNLSKVSELLAKSSSMSSEVNDLQVALDDQLEKSGRIAANREVPYIWSAPLQLFGFSQIGSRLSDAYFGQGEIFQYFINSIWDTGVVLLIVVLAFFIWVHRNFVTASRVSVKRKIGELKFDYLRAYPIMASSIVLLCLLLAFHSDAPSIFIEVVQLILMILITIHLRRVLPKEALRLWFMILGGFVFLVFASSLISEALLPRLILLAIHLGFLFLGVRMYGKTKIPQFSKRFIKLVIWVLVLMNGLAIIMNVFGRISLSKLFGIAGVINLTQMISLAVFIQIMLDALELQIKISSCNKGFFSRLNPDAMKSQFKKVLKVFSFIVWLLILFNNLGMSSAIYSLMTGILSKERSFGSIHFSLGNVLFFFIIIYVSNKLQKHVPLFFGEQKISFDGASDHKGSKVALFRLIIIVIGLLLAFTASGLPMDKLTVVLGALGVGIGLGMQNIVNNFVSGIILIFEKPFRIGDYVELADKRGKVQDIGIRSSKLLTPQGSEVIIPNGDLLSGRLVNWTLSNDYLKSELLIKVSSTANMQQVQEIISEVIKGSVHTVNKLPPEILVNNLAADSVEIKVLVWVNNVYVEAAFKSDTLMRIMVAFQEADIKVM
ncbi:mechanosensitive ion channel protein [Pedobacter sp. Leaf41]|uniref:mechanosensitive ion channel domain-containing protein n=1 Tax=Pedobacter sp. Leaf41 TaxID=1736218 RepID=UPI000703BC48|nr:mechanosensitive ion channel domain-containing protein [Pedobacter sp. Leaf41]KQN35997.1 mechanosensitive ion channel protein [Pedobacter sp. Leaf41]